MASASSGSEEMWWSCLPVVSVFGSPQVLLEWIVLEPQKLIFAGQKWNSEYGTFSDKMIFQLAANILAVLGISPGRAEE